MSRNSNKSERESFSAREALASRDAFDAVAEKLEEASPEAILTWALETYRARVTLACSFGGPSGMVLLHMTVNIDPNVAVFYLDTDLLFPATYELVTEVRERYGINPIAVRAPVSLGEQERSHGHELWKRDPDRCCALRKVAPQREFLRDYDAWITGVRRDQAPTRVLTPVVQWDDAFEVAKICPLARWTEADVWRYIERHDIPRNLLHASGYPSIGCIPCTRAIVDGEDLRAGRWPGSGKIECGLHAYEPAGAKA